MGSATLLSPKYAITSAYIVRKDNQADMTLGPIYVEARNIFIRSGPHYFTEIKHFPGYNFESGNLYPDIAILCVGGSTLKRY